MKDKFGSNLERVVALNLDQRGLKYVIQFGTLTGFILDFAFPNQRVGLEVDGSKWHSSKKAVKRDLFRDKCLRREGWKIERIPDFIINKPEALNQVLDLLIKKHRLV